MQCVYNLKDIKTASLARQLHWRRTHTKRTEAICMKLSIYLVREHVVDFNEVLQQKYREGEDAFVELQPSGQLPYECRAFVQRNKAKPPRWLPFLETHFETAQLNLINRSNSFVLLIKAAGRMFAVTFGHGFQSLDRAKIEPRFGLIVAASSLNPVQIRALETNLIDTVTRNKRTHSSAGSRVADFDVNPHTDWIRKLSGTPISENLAKSVSGSDSVCIGVDCDLQSVGAKCSELLAAYESNAYKEAFGYLDHLQPLGKHDPEIDRLEIHLAARLAERTHDRISIAFPEIPDEEQLDHFKVTGDRHAIQLEELTLEGIYQFLSQDELEPNPASIFVVGIGDNDAPVTKRRSLREYLVCEIEHDNETYIFCLGHWFRADRDYVQRIRREVAAIDDLTAELDLLPIRNREPEGKYNERLANDKLSVRFRTRKMHRLLAGVASQNTRSCTKSSRRSPRSTLLT
jgi:uncharacterized protein (TIGR04141 family)